MAADMVTLSFKKFLNYAVLQCAWRGILQALEIIKFG